MTKKLRCIRYNFHIFSPSDKALKAFLFGIPFSHPMIAPCALIFDEYLLVIGGIIYVSIFALIMISISVWVFKTDRLLIGSIKRKKINLRKTKK